MLSLILMSVRMVENPQSNRQKLNRNHSIFENIFNQYKPVDQIVLNGKELEIESVSVNDKVIDFVYSDDDETLTIKCPLDCGSHVINISYVGCHNDKRMGFYRTKHVNLEGKF